MNIEPVTVAQLTENRFDIGNVSTGAAIRLVCVPFACERFEKEQNRLTAFRFSFRKPFPVRFLKHIVCRPAGRGQDENACRGFAAAARNMHEKSANIVDGYYYKGFKGEQNKDYVIKYIISFLYLQEVRKNKKNGIENDDL